ncbi:type 1 glutamine amidotransferase [Falsiroseomonas oryziterrae]|uniref:type 1 glutamine amidotransferase n=1 Tax=Falsiroseomonas oryziterrae TaxID=2911368 RepID=UPI001F2BD55D|nr:type 1 glutamine amidotransferase [Roseomonas sp. NPKOSM-4]
MNILVVRNSEHAPEGAFGEWLRGQGHALRVTSGEALTDADMAGEEVVLLLGSPHGAYDTHIPWVARQRALLAARLAARRPTIGICFGAQVMAAAAGGDSRPHPGGTFHRGWLGIEHAADPVLHGPWPRWHGDVITPPPDAEVLAHDAGTVQSVALPRAIGVQFHPEATPEILQGWAERFTPPNVVDTDALAAASARHYPAREAARAALFAWLLRKATEA